MTTPASACEHRWEPDATGAGVICMNCGSDDPEPKTMAERLALDPHDPRRLLGLVKDPTLASAEPTEGERITAIVQAADHLSFMVTSYLLGDLDAATVQRALEAYSAARTQEVPF